MKLWIKIFIGVAAAVAALAIFLLIYNLFIYEPARLVVPLTVLH